MGKSNKDFKKINELGELIKYYWGGWLIFNRQLEFSFKNYAKIAFSLPRQTWLFMSHNKKLIAS